MFSEGAFSLISCLLVPSVIERALLKSWNKITDLSGFSLNSLQFLLYRYVIKAINVQNFYAFEGAL